MEETKFEDLKIKLGYPYVYTHQGNCEHLLIFRDLRYAFYSYELSVFIRKCMRCARNRLIIYFILFVYFNVVLSCGGLSLASDSI